MKHLQKINISDIKFLDIETARVVEHLEPDTPLWDSWAYLMKYKNNGKPDERPLAQSYEEEAALYAEFARIVCITVGTVKKDKIVLRTYADKNEATLLENFNRDLDLVTEANPKSRLGGHAVIDFDIPFILKRSIINGVVANDLIDNGAAKPWEVTHLDTKVLWRSSGSRNSSLINIAVALGIPSPKSDISGADVGRVYYTEGLPGLNRIIRYCEKDVVTTINCYLKMNYLSPISDENVVLSDIVEIVSTPILERINNKGTISAKDRVELVKQLKGMTEFDVVVEILEAHLFQKTDSPEEISAKRDLIVEIVNEAMS